MNELMIFNNPEFGEIRTIEEDGKVLFCGSDVAKALGYKNPSKALSDHCKGVTKRYTPTSSGKQEMNFIPEGDIYRLAAKSELPGADKFESWIFDEVLPSIRKTGGYVNDDELFIRTYLPYADEQSKDMFRATLGTIRNLNARIEQDKPKVLFADAVATAHTSILVGELAKLLKQNGVDIGQNRLFQKLREDGYLIRRQGNDYNMPTQRSMEMGLFEIKETVIAHADGHTSINKTPKVTGRGQQYFVERYLGESAS